MKKVLSIVLAICLVLSSCVIVFADNNGLSNFKKSSVYTAGLFKDVDEKGWYFDNVKAAFEFGLMKGSTDGNFNPNGDITLVETLTMAARIHRIYSKGVDDFVQGSPWYQVYVDYAVNNNIISANQFSNYQAKATREQFAQIMFNSIPSSEFNAINTVDDGAIPDVASSKFKSAIYSLYRSGILTGNDANGTFTPNSNIGRSSVAALVTRIVDKTLRKNITLKLEKTSPEPSVDVNSSILSEIHSIRELPEVGKIVAFEDYWSQSNITDDLTRQLGLTYSLTVSDITSIKNSPKTYDRNELLEWGKDPGLGVKILHEYGYTGKNAAIAYIDQPIKYPLHDEYKNTKLHYKDNTGRDQSMHGPAVLSLLAGKDIGTAPDAEIYYYSFASWEADQRRHAECLYQIIEQNKSLPESDKISMVGFSDNIDETEANADDFRKAVKACEDAGIMVWFCGEYGSAAYIPLSDKSNPDNLVRASGSVYAPSLVYVPSGGRTTAATQNGTKYIYWSEGGLSWTMPYMLGLYASAININHNLTQDQIRQLVVSTAFENSSGMKIVNPVEFIATVLDSVNRSSEAQKLRDAYNDRKQYVYAVMDTAALGSDDLSSIANYLSCLNESVVVIDAASYSSAAEVYSAIKADYKNRGGVIKGIQIFGNSDMVPAFMVDYKVQQKDAVDEGGTIISDIFYGNLNNEVSQIASGYNVRDAFANNSSVDLVPDWPVVRLPLSKGQYKSFFNKYNAYALETELTKQTITNFSNPIFASSNHIDDMGAFLNRMNKELKLIDSNYVLYGNLKGQYPVTTKVVGGFTKENFAAVNKAGITELLVNTHGQNDNIDCCYYENNQEKRESMLNMSNINTILNSNPYLLDCWTCLNAYGMKDNLVCTALTGQCVGAFAATTIISNNGVNNKASVDKLQNSNFYYFYYTYLKELNAGASRSQAFFAAQQAYGEALIEDSKRGINYSANYQYNLYNLICYENFGVLEPNVIAMDMYDNSGYIKQAGQSVSKQTLTQRTTKGQGGFTPAELTNGKPVGNQWTVRYSTGNNCTIKNEYEFYGLSAQKLDNGYVRVKLEYKAPAGMQIDVFNPPNGDVFMLFGDLATGEKQVFEYDLKISDLKSIPDITMKIFGAGHKEDETMYVFFKASEINK